MTYLNRVFFSGSSVRCASAMHARCSGYEGVASAGGRPVAAMTSRCNCSCHTAMQRSEENLWWS